MKLYHASHCVNRGSTERHGLLINPTEGEAVTGITGGIFLSSKRRDPSEQIDVWEVDVMSLPLQIDDTDSPP